MRVILASRSEERLRGAAACLHDTSGADIYAVGLDVTDRKAVERAALDLTARHGPVHLLCNCAGVNALGPMDHATYDDWDWVLGVNLHGVINVLTAFLPAMKSHGQFGHVVNVASMSSFIAGPASGLYATSKFAVRGLTESLRYNLAPHRIGVSLACPGLTKSQIYEASRNRPDRYAQTAFPIDDATMQQLQDIHGTDSGWRPRESFLHLLSC
jgi:NAD(P)-dependent dehydrogenase (short-subunit alcohol dehydrogenase family)